MKFQPLDFQGLTHSAIIAYSHNSFKDTIFNLQRPKLLKCTIVFNKVEFVEYKAKHFWHIISLGEDETFNIFPCNNDITGSICNKNCITGKYQYVHKGIPRNICYYRAARVNWIINIIELANDHNEHVKLWYKYDIVRKREELYLRFQEKHVDYVVIFAVKPMKTLHFVTAFPVFYISTKEMYDRDYNNYISSKK